MAGVMKTPGPTVLKIEVETGINAKGSAVYSARMISDINPDISDADALQIATAFGGLQSHAVRAIHRSDTARLATEG